MIRDAARFNELQLSEVAAENDSLSRQLQEQQHIDDFNRDEQTQLVR